MYKKTEYLLQLERLEYDLESKHMELEGLKKEYKDLHSRIKYYIVPFIFMLVFYAITMGSYLDDTLAYAFCVILRPIIIILIGIYVVYAINKIWNIYLNRNSEIARRFSEKNNKRSVSVEIERCSIEITNLEMKIDDIKEKIINLEA